MKRLACALAGLGLLAFAARADDKVEVKKDKNAVKIEKKHTTKNTSDSTKVESKARNRMGGGTVATTETTVEHKRPSAHSKTKTKETTERDAKGDVVRQEKKVQH
jgi:hypothetical protein